MNDELSPQERAWIDKLAKVMASGYGTDRGSKPTHVRSGVYRGALLALLPLVDEYIGDFQDGSELCDLGLEGMRDALTRNRFLPLP